jgi:two-component system, LuxR family, response regulator FixJ
MSIRPTIFVVDPDGLTRDAVRNLANTMDFQCDLYETGQDFLEEFDLERPGCVILELRVPGVNGLQIQQTLTELGATQPIVFLSARTSVSIAVHAMRAGALQFFEKPFREHDLWTAIEEAIELDHRRRETRRQQLDLEERRAALTAKEQRVLEMLATGTSKKVMAAELEVSVRTIEHYQTQLMRKLGTNSIAGLLHMAMSLRTGNGNGKAHGNGHFRDVRLALPR